METFTDENLAELAAKNNKEALEILVSRYLRPVYGYVFSYAKNAQGAEDLTQETFIKVWKNLRKYESNRPFRPWLYKIAKNTALDFLKDKSNKITGDLQELEQGQWLAQGSLNGLTQPEFSAENSLSADKLNLALKKLSPKYSEIISLYHSQNLKFREIAEIKRESINTIKSRYRRAMGLLKKLYN